MASGSDSTGGCTRKEHVLQKSNGDFLQDKNGHSPAASQSVIDKNKRIRSLTAIKRPDHERFWKRIRDFTEVGLLLAALLSLFYLHRQTNDLEHQVFLDERAWVGPISNTGPNGLHTEVSPQGATVFVVPFTNSGKTPALKVSAWAHVTTDITQITDSASESHSVRAVLFPNGLANTSTISQPVAAMDADRIRKGAVVYVFGGINYQDIFGENHVTRFCFVPRGRDLSLFSPCDRHNDTDDSKEAPGG